MKRLAVLSVLLLLSLVGRSALTQSVVTLPSISTITFPPGATLTTVNGQLAPDGRDLYYISAKAGQTLLVSISAEANLAFQVYPPEATLAKAADGRPLITGKALPEAAPNNNAKAWVGAIPRDGNYLIAVGATGNGGATAPSPYALTVSLQ